MKLISTRSDRLRRLVLTSMGVLLATAGVTALSPTPVQAGEAQDNGRLVAAIYNDSPFPLEYVGGWSQYGFNVAPTTVAVEDASPFELNGSPVTTTGWPDYLVKNTYNGWFTYKVTVAHTGGITEYITFDIHGPRQRSKNDYWPYVYPLLYVYQTSTPPPSTWRYTDGPPPNVLADPQFDYQHNVPTLYDQTITWDGDGPGDGVPSIVSLGDSTISGEGGRWAGNSNKTDGRDDAGSTWYWDTPSGESITDCHRSKSALVHIANGYRSHNFACSGAMTVSYEWDYLQGRRFKPGVDLICGTPTSVGVLDCPPGKMGQLNELYHYARTHNVKHVVLAVGANDFDFSGVVRECMELYLYVRSGFDFGQRCSESGGAIHDAIAPATRAMIEDDIYRSLTKLVSTMTSAGYDKSMYTVILQNYWSAIPSDQDIRIPDNYFRRQSEGGCPILFGDATALNETLLPAINGSVLNVARRFRSTAGNPVIRFMDVSQALKGHRLCEKGVGLIENIPSHTLDFFGKGTDRGAADKVEWVTEARMDVIGTDYTLAEGGHANYWGQLAQRNCLGQLVHGGWLGGKCVPATGGGVTAMGQPKMTLTPYQWW